MPSVLRVFPLRAAGGPAGGAGSLGVRLRAGQAWVPSPRTRARTRPPRRPGVLPGAPCLRGGSGGRQSGSRFSLGVSGVGRAGRRPRGTPEKLDQPRDFRGAVSAAARACREAALPGGRKPWAVVRKAGEEGHQRGRRAGGAARAGQRPSGLFPHLFPTALGAPEGVRVTEQALGRLSGRGMVGGRAVPEQEDARTSHARAPEARGRGSGVAAWGTRGRPRSAADTAAREPAVSGGPQAGPAGVLRPAGRGRAAARP